MELTNLDVLIFSVVIGLTYGARFSKHARVRLELA